jgi:hypothetical protein
MAQEFGRMIGEVGFGKPLRNGEGDGQSLMECDYEDIDADTGLSSNYRWRGEVCSIIEPGVSQ